jgi:hypothetical protein
MVLIPEITAVLSKSDIKLASKDFNGHGQSMPLQVLLLLPDFSVKNGKWMQRFYFSI